MRVASNPHDAKHRPPPAGTAHRLTTWNCLEGPGWPSGIFRKEGKETPGAAQWVLPKTAMGE